MHTTTRTSMKGILVDGFFNMTFFAFCKALISFSNRSFFLLKLSAATTTKHAKQKKARANPIPIYL